MSQKKSATLFTRLQLGTMSLKHRIVMAPLTRSHTAQPEAVPSDLVGEYYAQRASDGSFIIDEATNISPDSRGWYGVPGFWNAEQVEGRKSLPSRRDAIGPCSALVLSAGGHQPESAEQAVEAGDADAVTFGKYFVSNPDPVRRIHDHLPLTPYDHDTFYTFDPKGYIDYKPYGE